MENLLDNKIVLHSLLKQGDLANTINGGSSETYVSAEQEGNTIVIKVIASGVVSTDFKVNLNKNRLIISRHLNQLHDAEGQERLLVPSFLRHFDLPVSVDKGNIEAYYEDGVLRIIVPLQNEQQLNREIQIKDL